LFYNEETEKIVLAYLLKDSKFMSISRHNLSESFFNMKNFKRIFVAAVRVYDNWQIKMDYNIFKEILIANNIPPEEETQFLLLFKDIQLMDVDDDKFTYYTDSLKDMKIKRDLSAALSGYTSELIQNGVGATLLLDLTDKINRVKIDTGEIQMRKHFVFDPEFVDERLDRYDKRKLLGDIAGIPFGWKKMDEYTGGHFPGELALVFSRTGGGKTRVLHTLSYNAIQANKRGMFVTIEMADHEIARLYDSRMCRTQYDKMKKGKLSQADEDKWRSILSLMSAKDDKGLFVVDIPRGCTVSMIEDEISLYERRYGKLDFVTVDYLTLLRSTEHVRDSAEKVGELARQLKEMARLKNVSVLTAAQANRKVLEVKGEEAGTEHISVSDQVAAHCNAIMYLFRTPDDVVSNTIQVNLVKYRDGGNATFGLFADFPRSYIGDEIWTVTVKDDKKLLHGEAMV